MKNLILIIATTILFAFTTKAQEVYAKLGPSIAFIEMNCEASEIVPFGGIKVELGLEHYFIQHGVYAGAYVNYAGDDVNPSKQTVFDMGYIVNFVPNFNGYGIGYFGTGFLFRTAEHNAWKQNPDCDCEGNDYHSYNIPLRIGTMFMPYSEIRIYIEGEYTLRIGGDKFHGLTVTAGVKF